MNILALDPAISTGWACSNRTWGVEKFYKRPWRHPYAHYLDFRAWLVSQIENLAIEALATEAVLSTSKFMGNGQRHEWHGILLSVAAECDLPITCVMPSSLKKYATGYGLADRPQMRQALKTRFGLDLPAGEHDAIAAIWVLSWATQQLQDGHLSRSWSGSPQNSPWARQRLCNSCQCRFTDRACCPRCGWHRSRLEA